MSEEAKDRQAERLLQTALKIYGECDPPDGLEERILENLQTVRSKRSSAWLPVAAAAAALLIGVVLIGDWRAVEAPKTARVELPGQSVPRVIAPVTPTVPAHHPPPKRLERGGISTKTQAAGPSLAAVEESQVSPLPQSELTLSDIDSSLIEIEDLGRETTPLVSDLADAGPAPAAPELTNQLEEGRKQ